jgi:hypothetical protein
MGVTRRASPGVRDRARSQKIDVSFDSDLGGNPPDAWAAEIDQLIFDGSAYLHEVVFFHRGSRTLILADLIENFEPIMVTWGLRWILKLGGVADPNGSTPRDLRATFRKGRDRARACLERIRAWQPERIILSHGRWYPANGMQELDRAFRWLG